MSSRAGEPFDPVRAADEVAALAAGPLPASGPAVAGGDPATGEWTGTGGEGFRFVPLWEGDALTGAYGGAWTDAVDAAGRCLDALVAELDARWGPHARVPLHTALFARTAGRPLPPLLDALLAQDCDGDLSVWGPLPGTGRRAAVSLAQHDGDAPPLLVAVAVDGAVEAVPEEG
ncbi:hypothetical protein [uncultured Streptomyces sp.]|uniref:hypothetical protein n=1 Tax=uncultured Streptomyces sp. TaxID=174707 RepID=UPI00261A4D7E|nr:hypothetical protein [uncultured Streptomyces sp.]